MASRFEAGYRYIVYVWWVLKAVVWWVHSPYMLQLRNKPCIDGVSVTLVLKHTFEAHLTSVVCVVYQ